MGATGHTLVMTVPPAPPQPAGPPVSGGLPVCMHWGGALRGENMGTVVGRRVCVSVCTLGSCVQGWESGNTWGMSVQAKLRTGNRLM